MKLSFGKITMLSSLTLCLVAGSVLAQPPAPVPNAAAPTLNIPMPLGMQRGTTLDLTLTGTNLADPVQLLTSFPAKVTIPTENNNGKEATKLLVKLEVGKDAPLGVHWVRLATSKGVSALRTFSLDDFPQVVEVDTNRVKTTPQAVQAPCVVVGKAEAETSDWYKLKVDAKQRLVFEVFGRRLGSALDPQVTLYDATTGKELAGGHSNDAPGCQTDPRLIYTFAQAGEVLVEVRDVMFRGAADYGYRLRIADVPCALSTFPLAAKRGSKVSVNFVGPAVEGAKPVEVQVSANPQEQVAFVSPISANGLPGWPVPLLLSDLNESTEQEPNNEPTKANKITIPAGISGRFQDKGDLDHYSFAVKKGQKISIEGQTLELGTPTLLYLVLRDAKGAELAKSNPQGVPPLDQRLDYTVGADGEVTLEVQHLNYLGGPNEAYRLTITPSTPGFGVSVALDRWDVPAGAAIVMPLQATRRDYTGAIDVTVQASHPGLTGSVQIKGGAPPAANQPAGTLYLSAKPDVPPGVYTLTLLAKATINDKPVEERASVRGPISASLGNLAFPPLGWQKTLVLAVTPRPAFLLTAKAESADLLRGGNTNLVISADKSAGFDEEIALTAVGLPANVTTTVKSIPKGQKEVKVPVNATAAAALGGFNLVLTGKAKVAGKDVSVNALPLALTVSAPFDLAIAGSPIKLAPGAKVKVKVTATRKGGYQGPIALEVKNLPANVTATKVTLEKEQTSAEVELSAAANAAIADKADVNVVGTASALANQTQASPNFTLSIAK